MQYTRLGVYVPRKKKPKKKLIKIKKKVDWVNVLLFALLFIVVILFVVT